MRNLLILFLSLTLSSTCAAVSPCDAIDQRPIRTFRTNLAREIAKQLQASDVKILRSFRFRGWTILNVDSSQSDEAFLFYKADPRISHYITAWSGAARVDEELEIRSWLWKNARAIPADLASCFVWYVTEGRGEASSEKRFK